MDVLRPVDRWFIDEILPHEDSLIQAARRVGRDPEVARDLVQDVYARLYEMDGWATIAHPRQYALQMVRNLALERLRRAKIVQIQSVSDLDDLDVADDQPCQFHVVAGKHALELIGEALSRMPERCRTVLVRRRFDNQSPPEIARELGISLSTMEKRLTRAVALLTQALDPFTDKAIGADDEEGDRANAVNR